MSDKNQTLAELGRVDILPALKGESSTKWIFRLRVSSGFKYAFA